MIINCTPHPLTVNGREFPSSGIVPRVSTTIKKVGTIDGILVVKTVFGSVEGLPKESVVCNKCGMEEVGFYDEVFDGDKNRSYACSCGGEFERNIYIVSTIVLSALNGRRDDVFAPDTSPSSAIRNEKGQIVGVKRLTK